MSFVDLLYDGEGSSYLRNATSVKVSRDGAFVYALSNKTDAIAIFSRNTADGTLTFVEAVVNQMNGVEGLSGGRALILSHNGRQLYVAAEEAGAITLFQCNTSTGLLTYTATYRNNTDGIQGLGEVANMVINTDQDKLYATGAAENALVVFDRNPEAGTLTYHSTVYNDQNGVQGLQYPLDLVLGANDDFLYATGYSGNALVIFAVDAATGGLDYQRTYYDGQNGVDGLDGAMSLAMSDDGDYLYVLGKWETEHIASFRTIADSDSLIYLGVSTAEVSDAGGLSEPTCLMIVENGEGLFLSNTGGNKVYFFDRNMDTGDLLFNMAFQGGAGGAIPGMEYPLAIAQSRDNESVYVTGFNDASIAIFSKDNIAGGYKYFDILEESTEVQKMRGTSEVAISPDGSHLYSTSMKDHTVVYFSRDNSNGELSFESNYENGTGAYSGLAGAKSIEVSSDGAHVYATGFFDHSIVHFSRDAGTGALTLQSKIENGVQVEGLRGPCDLVISEDGKFVYVTAFWGNALFVFSRAASSGALSFVEKVEEIDGATTGLTHLTNLTFPAGEEQLLATSYHDHALVVFDRNPSTGKLTFKEMHQEGVDGVSGLRGACTMVIAGNRVLVGGVKDTGIAKFTRNSNTGALSFDSHFQGSVNGQALAGICDLRASPSEEYLYAVSPGADFLMRYTFNSGSGQLSGGELVQDGVGGVSGLDGAVTIGMSADGEYIYVGSFYDHAIAVFRE